MNTENAKQITSLAAGIRRVIAPNASPMTYWGTNTYLIGEGKIAVIDPGPADQDHLDAITNAAGGPNRISHIFVTHAHVDHSLGARPLAALTGAPIYAYGDAHRGQSDLMKKLVRDGLSSGGEGVDAEFQPDIQLEDGQVVHGDAWSLQAVWTPGHISNHICLAMGEDLFSGDHVMDWATSIVSPPDGDVSAFLASCEKLLQRRESLYFPGHGNPVEDPKARTQWLINHRRERERQIREVLIVSPKSPSEIVQEIYTDIPKALYGAAERNVFAHIIDLVDREIVISNGPIRVGSTYQIR